MPWDRKRLSGHVEIIQLILGVTDKYGFCIKNYNIVLITLANSEDRDEILHNAT